MVDEGLTHVLNEVNCPTLIMWGEQDAILDVSCVQAIKKYLPEAKEVILPNVGHLPMLEAPRQSAKAVTLFLRTI